MDKILSEGELLDNKGNLRECGFSYDLVREYNRKDIKGLKKDAHLQNVNKYAWTLLLRKIC